jgi:hypothetical protein
MLLKYAIFLQKALETAEMQPKMEKICLFDGKKIIFEKKIII